MAQLVFGLRQLARLAFFMALLVPVAAQFAVVPPAMAQTALEDAEAAVGEAEADFRIMLDSVDTTTENLDTFLDNLQLADKTFVKLIDKYKNDPAKVRELKEALRLVRTVEAGVNDQLGDLKLLSKSAGHVKSAFDIYDQVQEMRERAAARKGGPLAGNLSMLADVMKEYGGDVPLLGKAIEMYGTMTTGLLDATDKLAGTISDNYKQGMIGVGTSQNIDDPRYLRFKEQFPQTDITLAPEGPSYLFKNIDTADQKNYIWDEDANQWYVAKGPTAARTVFSRVLMAGTRPTPAQLAFLVKNGATAAKREADARSVLDVTTRLRRGINMDTEFEAVRLFGFDLMSDQGTPDLFLARYIYDGRYRDLVRNYAAAIWADAMTRRASGHVARALERWAGEAGFDLFDTLTPEQQELLKKRLAAIEAEKKKREEQKQKEVQARKAKSGEKPEKPVAAKPRQPAPADQPVTPPKVEEPAPAEPPPAVAPPQPELPANTKVVPWDESTPRSVCLAYHTRASTMLDQSSYRNLIKLGDPVVNEKEGTCTVRYSGEMKDVNGVWRPMDGLELSVKVAEVRNLLSQLDGENAYERVCTKWKTVEWCAGQEQICTETSTTRGCIRWKGAIASPECAEWKTYTQCSKHEWICTKPMARTYCDKWGPADRAAVKQPAAPPSAKEPAASPDNDAAGKAKCAEILKKYPPSDRSLKAMQARLQCVGIAK